jgi:hypothetical protein
MESVTMSKWNFTSGFHVFRKRNVVEKLDFSAMQSQTENLNRRIDELESIVNGDRWFLCLTKNRDLKEACDESRNDS